MSQNRNNRRILRIFSFKYKFKLISDSPSTGMKSVCQLLLTKCSDNYFRFPEIVFSSIIQENKLE